MAAMRVIEVGGHDGWEDAYYDAHSTVELCQAFECVAPTIYDSAWCRAHEDPTSRREDCDCRGCGAPDTACAKRAICQGSCKAEGKVSYLLDFVERGREYHRCEACGQELLARH